MEFFIAAYPLRYLSLQAQSGRRLIWRDLPGMIAVAFLISTPYALFPKANFFHVNGFVDKIGTFSSVLTGFYVAGLVAVATFPFNKVGLDKVIDVGPVYIPNRRIDADGTGLERNDDNREAMTRREYVCSMFGYLAFMSMITTISSIICVNTIEFITFDTFHCIIDKLNVKLTHDNARMSIIFICCLILSSLFVTTSRALYYLIYRLYSSSPELLPLRRDGDIEEGEDDKFV